MSSNDLFSFLEAKPLFYDEIDYERFPRIYDRIKNYFTTPKTIHIVGTNGKGTTGRFLAEAIKKASKRVGHYTSPHIMRFHERIWIDGREVDDALLQKMHKKLQSILTHKESEELSYFEYTTLLAMLCFEGCEYLVLEAGLGGEHDATAVFPKELTILTPVDRDHEAFLGESIKEITKTKLGAIADTLIVAKQYHKEVEDIAKEITKQKKAKLYKTEEILLQSDKELADKLQKRLELPEYLKENLQTSIAALKLLKIPYSITSFEEARLFGRLTKILPNVLVDVGHNPLAARSITKALKGHKVVLIYNSFKDKDYYSILSLLKPIIKRVEILELKHQRIAEKEALYKTLNELKIQYTHFSTIKKDQFYLVFGSFSVVEEFLKRVNA
ncbi:Dihydrofolate synthase @ Folylpolyglutamate synthase [hydrothermal vent metagenome]|uniref:Dihydrofolate synthase @ Folylpolyglutamate synthase n=1 Tax=hydrothermal vent metagenome TaxID=652676 RepID=A0A1W1BB33_9ZZZZ